MCFLPLTMLTPPEVSGKPPVGHSTLRHSARKYGRVESTNRLTESFGKSCFSPEHCENCNLQWTDVELEAASSISSQRREAIHYEVREGAQGCHRERSPESIGSNSACSSGRGSRGPSRQGRRSFAINCRLRVPRSVSGVILEPRSPLFGIRTSATNAKTDKHIIRRTLATKGIVSQFLSNYEG